MAEETKAILTMAKEEAPDMTVTLHSYSLPPSILQPTYIPFILKEEAASFSLELNKHYKNIGIAHMPDGWIPKASIDDEKLPLKKSFNLASALHHVSGTLPIVFECSHGTTGKVSQLDVPDITYNDILDIELNLYKKMFEHVLGKQKILE